MLKVQDFGDRRIHVDRELVLVKVNVDSKTRAEVMQITDIFRAKIVDVQPKMLTIEVTGNDSKIEKFLDLMKTFGVTDITPHRQVRRCRASKKFPAAATRRALNLSTSITIKPFYGGKSLH